MGLKHIGFAALALLAGGIVASRGQAPMAAPIQPGSSIHVLSAADHDIFLRAFAAGRIYYDPAVKVENASSGMPLIKRRSQFRVAHADLTQLYQRHELVQL